IQTHRQPLGTCSRTADQHAQCQYVKGSDTKQLAPVPIICRIDHRVTGAFGPRSLSAIIGVLRSRVIGATPDSPRPEEPPAASGNPSREPPAPILRLGYLVAG